MLKLQCAEIVHTLRYKPILMFLPPDGEPIIVEPSSKARQRLLAPILTKIHTAQKFIFDSGQDKDERTVSAVKDTAKNMLEAGLFHQPHPVMWIEDPFEDSPDTYRNFYLAIETETQITIRMFAKLDYSLEPKHGGLGIGRRLHKRFPNIGMVPMPLIIDLTHPSDQYGIGGADSIGTSFAHSLGETVYSYKKLIVTLNTENLSIDHVKPGGKREWDGNPKTRPYEHTIVRIPLDVPSGTGTSGEGGQSASKRRKHLVRGFVWGKHTRPLEEQRWIKAYWRGDAETEVRERSHYVVR